VRKAFVVKMFRGHWDIENKLHHPKAFFPERIEYFQRHSKRAVGLVVRATRL
jgi:hypothetical protein